MPMMSLNKILLTIIIWIQISHLPFTGASLNTTFLSCSTETRIDVENIVYIKGQKFGLFDIFSRHQVIVLSEMPIKVMHRTIKDDLIKAMKSDKAGFQWNWFSWASGLQIDGSNQSETKTRIDISAFADNYIGFLPLINSIDKITVLCDFASFDAKLLALCLIGAFIFLFADSFSRNVLFYYTSGMIISLFMSWMIILIIILRLIPYKKSIFIVTIAFGGSFGLFLTQSFIRNLQYLAQYHSYWLIRYTCVVCLLSLAYLYYKGPPKNATFFDLARWCMRLFGLVCIYNCTWAREVAVTAIVFTIALRLLLKHFDVSTYVNNWESLMFGSIFNRGNQPRKRRLITEEEYIEEAKWATSKAMEDLRGYCSSPECNTWKIVSRLKDPKRFAVFMETGKSLDDDELAEYENYTPEEDKDSWLSEDDEEEKRQGSKDETSEEENFSFSDVSS